MPPAQARPLSLMPLAADAPLHPAGFISRLLAFVLDIVIVSVGALVFAALVSLFLNFFGLRPEQTAPDISVRNVLGILQNLIVVLSGLAVLLFIPGYFVLFWVLVGATPGMQILGLRVVRSNGQMLSWSRAIVRYIGYFLSAIILLLGFLWVFIDGRRQGWHDKLADTLVVYQWQAPEDE